MKVSDVILQLFSKVISPHFYYSESTIRGQSIQKLLQENAVYKKFWVLPYRNGEIELPIGLVNKFLNRLPQGDTDVAIPLFGFSIPNFDVYKSASTAISKCFSRDFLYGGGLEALYTTSEREQLHYGSPGLIFNSNFIPELTCSWKIKVENNTITYVTPIIRFNPQLFLIQKKDAITSAICNTIFKGVIGKKVKNPITYEYQNLQVLIENWQYPIVIPSVPNINTTDEDLQQFVLENLKFPNR